MSNNNSKDRAQELLDHSGVNSVFEKNQGIGFEKQAIFERANGKYILNADTDGIYPPTWVESLPRYLVKGWRCCYI